MSGKITKISVYCRIERSLKYVDKKRLDQNNEQSKGNKYLCFQHRRLKLLIFKHVSFKRVNIETIHY